MCQELYIHFQRFDSFPPPNKENEVDIIQMLKKETFRLREVQSVAKVT